MNIHEYIDHTNLKPFATRSDIEKLCAEAAEYHFKSVCVNPFDVAYCKKLLEGTGVLTCTVIGFPLGRNLTETKAYEAELAYRDGADEFDMVINVGMLKDKRYDEVKSDIEADVKAAKGKTVKVILETGLLTEEEIAEATKIACAAGTDFVKTCTGIGTGSATVEAVSIMKANVSNGVKIKASGGVRTYEQAMAMIEAGAERLGTSSGAAIIEGSKG